MDFKRLFLALSLSFVFIYVWQIFFVPPISNPNNINQLNVSTLLINSTIKQNFENLPSNTKMINLEGDHDIHAQKPDLISKIINDEISKGFFR